MKDKYEDYVLPKLVLIEAWARDGLTEEDISKKLNISYSSFRTYKNQHLALLTAIKKGREDLDVEVENAFIKKCFGYNVPVKKNIKVKTVEYNSQGYRVRETEEIREVFDEQHIPADTTNQIFYLKNRRGDRWRDKQETDIKFSQGDFELTIKNNEN